MSVTIDTMKLADVLHVCQHMRKADWAEVINLLPRSVTTPDQIAMICMQASAIGLVAKVDGEPVAVLQFAQVLDGSFRAGLFGTDRFTEVALPLVVDAMENLVPYLLDELDATYCDAYTDVLHPDAHKLLEFIGFAKCAILPEYGSRGRDIALYVLTKREANVLRNGRWKHIAAAAAVARRLGRNHQPAGIP